jgi:hypothetical protein
LNPPPPLLTLDGDRVLPRDPVLGNWSGLAIDVHGIGSRRQSKCSKQECRLGASLENLLLKNKALLKLRHAFFDSAYNLLGQVAWATNGNYFEPSQA